MKPWIEAVLKLQDTDLRIRQLSTRIEMIPIEISKIEKDIEKEKEELHKKKEGGISSELEIKQVESDIMKYDDEIEKLQKQSVMIKKNDEYKALMTEINNAKAKISELETRELELMEVKDEFHRTWKKDEKIVRDKENTLNEEKADLVNLESRLKEEVQSLISSRDELCNNLEKEVLAKYTKLLNKGIGQPLIEVHDGNCGNCHLKLTPQTVNTASKQDLVHCENCSHLLYVAD